LKFIIIKKMNTTERKLATTTREQSNTTERSNSIKSFNLAPSQYFNFLVSLKINKLKIVK
jgi:hypothetical protein